MKLHTLHVQDGEAGAPCHGNPIPGGRIRIGSVEVDLSGSAGGKNGMRSTGAKNFSLVYIEDIGADAARWPLNAKPAGGHEVQRHGIGMDLDVRFFLHLLQE